MAELLTFFLMVLFWAVAGIGPLGLFYYVIYRVVSLPYRWLERARFFLDVLEAGINEGISAEQTVIALADRHERTMGPQLQELATALREGRRLGQALEIFPQLLPPQIVAMLKVGEETGDLKAVFPAGRKVLDDDIRQTQQSRDGMMATISATLLTAIGVFFMLGVFVYPKMQGIAADMEIPLPHLVGMVADNLVLCLTLQAVVLGAVVAGSFLYMGGPRQVTWLETTFPRIGGSVFHWLPWRYKRVQRDFAFMLATLLDAQVPEEKAVTLAGNFTGSGIFKKRVAAVIADLRQGIWLPTAIAHVDGQGEFRWRLASAVYKPVSFVASLMGWMDMLDAKAFQEEQIATQGANLVLILYCAFVTAVAAIGVFQFLISLINLGTAW